MPCPSSPIAFAPVVADFAVKLGPPEYFMLMVLAFTTVSAVLGKSTLRGMTALLIGLAVGCIGLDQISGQARYTAGVPELLDGIEIVLVAVGLFAVAEVLYAVLYEGRVVETQNRMSKVYMTGARVEALDCRRGCARTAIGVPFGCIPAGGTEIPTFLSYATEKKLAKAQGGVRHHRRDRRRGRARGGQQRDHHRGADPAADAGHSRPRTPRRSCSARSRTTASSPGRSCSTATRRWCGR